MKRLTLCLAILFSLTVPGAAEAASGASAVVPLNTWPFAAADTLQKAGIPVGHPDVTVTGRRVVTREDFAVATARILQQVMPDAHIPRANIRTDVADRLRGNLPAVSALIALAHEFAPELGTLRPDVPQQISMLQAVQERQRRIFRAGRVVLTPDQLEDPFADVSQTDPARHDEDTLQKSGIVFGVLDGTYSGYPPETRLQMAQDVARLTALLSRPSALTKRFKQNPQDAPALYALATEFAPELKLLGQGG